MRCHFQISTVAFVWMLLSLISTSLFGQEDRILDKDQLAKESGLDAIYIDKYDFRLKDGSAKKPIRTKFKEVFLEANIKYRFILLDNDDFPGDPFLQLLDRQSLLASSNNPDNEVNGNPYFEFVCEESKDYLLRFSSSNGKATNTTTIFTMVLEDTTTVFDNRVSSYNEQPIETLYLGVENKIVVTASDVNEGYLEVNISEGTIKGENGVYNAEFQKPGYATVNVKSYKKDSTFQEESNTLFIVKAPPPPQATISGIPEGFIARQNIGKLTEIELRLVNALHIGEYEIVEFMIGKDPFNYTGFRSKGSQISITQRNFISNLLNGSSFYLKHVVLKDPKGKLLYPDAIQYRIN